MDKRRQRGIRLSQNVLWEGLLDISCQVEMSARIRTEFKEDGTLTLTIDEVTKQDAGEYRLVEQLLQENITSRLNNYQ